MSELAAPGTPSLGMPLALELGLALERCRVASGGMFVSASPWSRGERGANGLGFRCVLDDGTGRIDLLFVGRDQVPGLVPSARCDVEGTARMEHGRLTPRNPLYRLRPDGGGGEARAADE